MATLFSSTLVSDITTDARFRANAQFIEDTIVTTGQWLLSTESGDTAPASLVHPTAVNIKKGFRVYKTNDGLTQIYMRVDYGSSTATSGNGLGLWITLGTGSDGAGTITGKIFDGGAFTNATVASANVSAGGVTGAVNSYGSADTGRLQLGLFISSTVANIIAFSLERTKDSSGADTSDGILLACTTGGVSSIWGISPISSCMDASAYRVVAGGTQPTPEWGLSYTLTRLDPSETFGGDIGLGMLQYFKGQSVQPGVGVATVKQSDVSAGGSFSASLYGSSRTYQHLNSLLPCRPTGANSATANAIERIVIRYD